MRYWLALAFLAIGAGACRADLRFHDEALDDGAKLIVVKGQFDSGDDLAPFDALVLADRPVFVTFDSPGGSIIKAMELGRRIRALGLATVQPRRLDCASACALAFFGGVFRAAEAGAIGVHKSSFSPDFAIDSRSAVSAIQQMTAELMSYMIEMGVDPALLAVALRYEPEDVRYLSLSEMRQYRVVTAAPTGDIAAAPAAPAPRPAPTATRRNELARDLTIPTPRGGKVRRPGGNAPLKADNDRKAKDRTVLENGKRVEILAVKDDWYKVRSGLWFGYMHNTWIKVDQFDSGPFDRRHVQVKSLRDLAEAETYALAAPRPLAVYLATNGWYAITLDGTFEADAAKRIRGELVAAGVIPDDAIITYGNNYVRKLCCTADATR